LILILKGKERVPRGRGFMPLFQELLLLSVEKRWRLQNWTQSFKAYFGGRLTGGIKYRT
jgi:hypothetical protein